VQAHCENRFERRAVLIPEGEQMPYSLPSIDSPDSWFESAAVIDPRTGKVQKIETTFSGDIHGPGWTKDGRIIATGLPTQSSLWRFRPEK